MPSRQEIFTQLNSHSTNERQDFTRAYAGVIPGYPINFVDRDADKTVDSHDVVDLGESRQHVTRLALDGSIPVLPYLTLSGDIAGAGQLEKAADTALGAVANTLKPLEGSASEATKQTEAYKERRLDVRNAMIDAALLAIELEHVGGSDAYVNGLAHFLYDAGDRLRLNDDTLSALTQNLSFVTTGNIDAALQKTSSATSPQEAES